MRRALLTLGLLLAASTARAQPFLGEPAHLLGQIDAGATDETWDLGVADMAAGAIPSASAAWPRVAAL